MRRQTPFAFHQLGKQESKEKVAEDWFTSFLKRHPRLSICTPEATSLSRVTSFNQTNLERFFYNLSEVMNKYQLDCNDIYNCDETGIITVLQPHRIFTKRGAKQVGAISSSEQGQLITIYLEVKTSGSTISHLRGAFRK